VVVWKGQIWRIGWVIKILEAQVSQLIPGYKWLVRRGIVVQEQYHLLEILAKFFPQNVLQLHQWRWVTLPDDYLALWKIINEEDAVLIPKKSRRELLQRIFTLWIFGGEVTRHAATPLIVILSPGHTDITRFCPWSPIAPDRKSFGSDWKNFKCFSHEWHRWSFWSAFRHFRTHFAESFRMYRSSWIMHPTRSREMPSCSAIDLAEIRRSSRISSWIWSINSGVVTVMGRKGRSAAQMEKSRRLNCATQFLTVAYDGACSRNNSIRMAWIYFGALPCRKKEAWGLVSMLKSRASPDILPFSPCNKKRFSICNMNRPLFPTTLSIPSYDIGKYGGLRTYQHFLV